MHIPILLGGLALYFLPIIIASARNTEKGVALMLFSLFLGWTGIGWLIALIWACSAETKQQALYRRLAEQHLRSGAAMYPPAQPTAPSVPLNAGRLLGGMVRGVRSDPEPPPSIRPQSPLDRLIDRRLQEDDRK